MKPTYVGILVASLFIIFKMILFFAGLQDAVKLPWVPLLGIVLIGLFYSINHYVRTSDTYDWMGAFKKGLTVALVASVFCGIFILIYYSWIDTNYLEQRSVDEYNQLKSQIPKEKMTEYNESLKKRYRPSTFAIITVSAVNIIGLIGSLLVALLGRMTVRRK